MSRLSVILAVAALVTTSLTTPASAVTAERTIATARALPLGTTVVVEGTATTPSGVFESSFSDKGFAIQDRTAGIYVKTTDDLGVRPGRKVRVTGVLTDSSGLRTIVPATAGVVLGRWDVPVRPEPVRTGDIGEPSEGRLVRVLARVTRPVEDDLPYGHKVHVDDGSGEVIVFLNTQTGIAVDRFAVGQRVRVVGFSSQYGDHYEIDPRGPKDLVVLPGS